MAPQPLVESIMRWAGIEPAGARDQLPEGDEVARLSAQLAEFDRLLSAFHDAGKAMAQAAEQLEAAPRPLLEHIEMHGAQDLESPGGRMLSQLRVQLAAFAGTARGAGSQVEAMHQLVMQARFGTANARDALTARKEAWVAKVHAEREFEEMYDRNKRDLRIAEKRERLSAKVEAEEVWEASTRRAAAACRAVLERKWEHVGDLVEQVCGYYSALQHGGKSPAQRQTWWQRLWQPGCCTGTTGGPGAAPVEYADAEPDRASRCELRHEPYGADAPEREEDPEFLAAVDYYRKGAPRKGAVGGNEQTPHERRLRALRGGA